LKITSRVRPRIVLWGRNCCKVQNKFSLFLFNPYV
jgi:hypothetical protein